MTSIYKRSISLLSAIMLSALLACPAFASSDMSGLSYYLNANASRYEAYQAAYPELSYDKVVAYVNASVDKAHYADISIIEDPSDIRLFLSKNFALPSAYAPEDLVTLSGGEQLRTAAAEAFEEMRIAANSEGLTLIGRSSYRSHGSQVASYNLVAENYGRAGAEASVARPGHSEHQTGLALDIMHKAGTTGPLTVQGFGDSKEYLWLLEHAHEYGFILRYPAGYEHIHGFVYEPWHWRYVGLWIAKRMADNEIATYEEYYGKYLAPEVLNKMRLGNISLRMPTMHEQ